MADIETPLRLLRAVSGREGCQAVASAREGQALELVTVDPDGYPRVSWIGPAEVVVCSSDCIGLALWSSSRTVRNVLRTRSGLLQFVAGSAKIGIRLSIEYCCDIDVGDTTMAAFQAKALAASTDSAPYAEIVAGPTFRLAGGSDRFVHWQRQLDLLTNALESWKDGKQYRSGDSAG